MLVDGPAVLGWAQWRAVDEAASGRLLAEALTELIAAGIVVPQPVAPVTRLLSGAMNEAALWLARSPDLVVTSATRGRALARPWRPCASDHAAGRSTRCRPGSDARRR